MSKNKKPIGLIISTSFSTLFLSFFIVINLMLLGRPNFETSPGENIVFILFMIGFVFVIGNLWYSFQKTKHL